MIINEGDGRESLTTLEVAYDVSQVDSLLSEFYSGPDTNSDQIRIENEIDNHIAEPPMIPKEKEHAESVPTTQSREGYAVEIVRSWPLQTKDQATSSMTPTTTSES